MNSFIRKSFVQTAFVACALSACASKTINLDHTTGENEGDLVILTTSDFHSTLDRAEGLYNTVQSLRKIHGKKTIHLDGGDLFQGSLEGNLNKGKSIVEFYNHLGVDAAAIGNHELDYGPEDLERNVPKSGEDGLGNLKRRVKEAKYQWLSSNWIRDTKTKCDPLKDDYCNGNKQKTVFKPHAIFERGAYNPNRVCVIGGTTPTTPRITNQLFVTGTKFEPLKETLIAEVDFMRKNMKCDFVIMMMHAGLVCDQGEHCKEPGDMAEALNLLNSLPFGYLDAVIAGHTHQRAREIVNSVPVIEAGCYGKQVGVLHLFKKGKNPSQQKLPSFENWHMTPDKAEAPVITNLLRPYREAASSIKNRPVGAAKDAFIRDYLHETALGNLIADVTLDAGKKKGGADFSLLNAGGIRNDFAKGELNYGDIFKVMPFDNSLVLVKLKGSEFRSLVELALSGANGMPPIGGFKVKRLDVKPSEQGYWDRDLNGDGKAEAWERNIITELVDSEGKPIDDKKIYTIATIDFLALGAERQDRIYSKIPAERMKIYSGLWVRDFFENYLKVKKEIDPSDYYDAENPRITLIKPLNSTQKN